MPLNFDPYFWRYFLTGFKYHSVHFSEHLFQKFNDILAIPYFLVAIRVGDLSTHNLYHIVLIKFSNHIQRSQGRHHPKSQGL
jgi:hypothetical protein